MSKLLVVVDMQNDFIDGALGTKEAQSIVPNVIKKLEEYDASDEEIDVVFTMDTHDSNYMDTEEGKNLPVEHCIRETEGWKIKEELLNACSSDVTVIEKDTFGSEDLLDDLSRYDYLSKQYDEIELIGICTGVCLTSQVVICKTAQPNAHIVVDAACCACVTPHTHDVAIEAMKTLQVEIRNEGKEPWRE